MLFAVALATGCTSSTKVDGAGITTTYPSLPIVVGTTTTSTTVAGAPVTTAATTTSSIPEIDPVGPPQVLSFTAGLPDCTKAQSGVTQVQVSWRTTNTIAVYINGGTNAYQLGDPKSTNNFGIEPASGSAEVPFICNDLKEFYRLGAYGSNNRSASSAVEVDHQY